ncbi:hypothetical protein QQF64_018740 [Cirrhinus molitorella]|uniref:VIT domain-containing protein n=1 Tax=Cirrhinus molitorella TaxID=172907 RepID=A0ABR3LGX0_9TELE
MEICGPCDSRKIAVPLKSISVEVRVQDHVATVSSTLQYVNEEERPLEALFVFPLPADAAVCHFSAKIGEQEIVAEVQDRESARDQYDDAVSSGQQAFLLEESAESPDVFKLSSGVLSGGIPISPSVYIGGRIDHCAARGTSVVMGISLYPEFPREVMKSLASQGHSLLQLKSLPMRCYFNIYGFGSRFEAFFPQSVEYNQDTMDQALKRVKEMQADMGGTEILQPLKHIYSQPCYPNHPRQLFIFTDGEVFNTKEVLDLVKGHAHFSLGCFSFGIGEGASAALITGMAREGSGHAQFITDTDRMQPKMALLLTQLSPPINVLSRVKGQLIYAQIKGESSGGSEGSVTVKYSLKDQPVTNQLHFCLKPTEETGLSIHRLAARTLIRSLEQEERSGAADVEDIRSRMVELSVQAGASGCWELDVALADVFGKRKDELTNQKPAQRCKKEQAGVVASLWPMKAVSWIAFKMGDLSQCVCLGNILLGYQVTKETLGVLKTAVFLHKTFNNCLLLM